MQFPVNGIVNVGEGIAVRFHQTHVIWVCLVFLYPGLPPLKILNDSIFLEGLLDQTSLRKKIIHFHYFLGDTEKWVTLKHLFIEDNER